jgi:hypothetical protein
MGTPLEVDDIWLERIKQSVNGLSFGQVQIIIHDGRIVQIERTERKRFESDPKPSIDNGLRRLV